MANNLTANIPFSGTASKTVLLADIAAITAASIGVIFKVGDPLRSYIPGRAINGITSLERGAGYYIQPKTDLDLSDFFIKAIDMITLTDAATIAWNLGVSNVAKVNIAANRNITITGANDGDRGILQVEHGAANTSITLPGTKADGFAWKTGSGQTTVLGFLYTTAKGFLWFYDGFATT
jgi:hypothetical protein